jgi:hypothetical protein
VLDLLGARAATRSAQASSIELPFVAIAILAEMFAANLNGDALQVRYTACDLKRVGTGQFELAENRMRSNK